MKHAEACTLCTFIGIYFWSWRKSTAIVCARFVFRVLSVGVHNSALFGMCTLFCLEMISSKDVQFFIFYSGGVTTGEPAIYKERYRARLLLVRS